MADVVIDVAVGTRSGIPPGEGAVALAQLIDKLPNLKLRGILSYDGGVQHAKVCCAQGALKAIEPNVASYEAMKKSGLNLEIFSGGGTGTYNIMHAVPGFTDVQVGSYLFMDMQYLAIGSESGDEVFNDFAPSLTVLATVLNNRFPGRLTTDAGAKALTPQHADCRRDRSRAWSITPARTSSAASGTSPPSGKEKIGDVLEVIVPHCDPP